MLDTISVRLARGVCVTWRTVANRTCLKKTLSFAALSRRVLSRIQSWRFELLLREYAPTLETLEVDGLFLDARLYRLLELIPLPRLRHVSIGNMPRLPLLVDYDKRSGVQLQTSRGLRVFHLTYTCRFFARVLPLLLERSAHRPLELTLSAEPFDDIIFQLTVLPYSVTAAEAEGVVINRPYKDAQGNRAKEILGLHLCRRHRNEDGYSIMQASQTCWFCRYWTPTLGVRVPRLR